VSKAHIVANLVVADVSDLRQFIRVTLEGVDLLVGTKIGPALSGSAISSCLLVSCTRTCRWAADEVAVASKSEPSFISKHWRVAIPEEACLKILVDIRILLPPTVE
jgi:hypothetical protein